MLPFYAAAALAALYNYFRYDARPLIGAGAALLRWLTGTEVQTALAGAMGRILGFELEQVTAGLERSGFAGPNLEAARQAYEAVEAMGEPAGAPARPAAAS